MELVLDVWGGVVVDGGVANLAHGLRTPLATLAIALPKDGLRANELRTLVDTMERRIRHH